MIEKVCWVILLFCIMTGCKAYKKVWYLQDLQTETNTQIDGKYEVKIQKGDILMIIVSPSGGSETDLELVTLFNLPTVSPQMGTGSSQQKVLGYLVNTEGKIDFPILGKVQAEGLTIDQLSDTVKQRIVSEGYMQREPVVTIQYQNLKYSVLGEVSKPGEYLVNGERITILEAISKAGDLTMYGLRDRVFVIREQSGKRETVRLDLRNSDIFNSPYYYLQQNDVIYVQPNKIKASQRNINTYTSMNILSVLSLMLTLGVLIF